MGLMLLTGTPGLPSLGHATFMALGCYLNINLLGAGVPWLIAFPLSGLIAGVLGTMIALPVLRLHGVYLALATLAMSMLTSDFVVIAEPWTGGIAGCCGARHQHLRDGNQPLLHPVQVLLSGAVRRDLACLVLPQPVAHTDGRSFTAVRDSEISARAMGINLTRTKAMSFFLSATAAGLAGALFGHSGGLCHERDIRSGHVDHFAVDDRDWWLGLHPRRLLRRDCGWHHSGGDRQRAIISGDHL